MMESQEHVDAYLKFKNTLSEKNFSGVIQSFIDTNGKSKIEQAQLKKLMESRERLYEMCRIITFLNSFEEKDRAFVDYPKELKKFLEGIHNHLNK